MEKNKISDMQILNEGQTPMLSTPKPTLPPKPNVSPLGAPGISSTPKPTPPNVTPTKPR